MNAAMESGGAALPERPQGSAWSVYGRLVRMAMAYPYRLAFAALFAFIIAIGFGAMLLALGGAVEITFYEPPANPALAEDEVDPAVELAQTIREKTDDLRDLIGWAPQGLDERILVLAEQMRARKMRFLAITGGLILGIALIIGISQFLQEYLAGSIGVGISVELAERMYENVMRQPVSFFEQQSSGEVLARFTNDVLMVNRGLGNVLIKLMREPLKALVFLLMALAVDPFLTLIGICGLPPVAFVLIRVGQKVRKRVRRSLQKIAAMASVVNETIKGITIVKGYGMEAYEVRRVHDEIERLRRHLLKVVQLSAATSPVTDYILMTSLVIFVLMSGQRVVNGELSAGELTQLYLALMLLLDPVRKLSTVNNLIQTSVASAERVFEFIDREPDIAEAPNAIELPRMREGLRLEHVSFSYDGVTAVLVDINLDIKQGETIALVGFSGAGKSTLIKLLPRFYDPDEGRILMDGRDIREASFESLRRQISIVTQETVLFAESVRANIAHGSDEYSDEQVFAAAKAANADGFIARLPEGYDAILEEAGGSLSGGQRQRLAIARAFVKDPAILILDEATSNLDSESENLIQEALDRFLEGRTAIIIAHRLSTVQRADRIVLMSEGRIAEQGTHEELLARGGQYHRLYEMQFGPQEATA